jgi:hypothetical protein
VCQQVQRRLAQNGGANKNRWEVVFVGIEDYSALLSDLTSKNNESLPTTNHNGIVILCPNEFQAKKKADQANCVCFPTMAG